MMRNNIMPTFLKWAGGKKRMIQDLKLLFPHKIERYFEPFLGGGAVFFYIKQKFNPKFCMISDINKDLIETYKTVRDNPTELIKHLKYFKKHNSKEFYYKIREEFNKHKLKGVKRYAAFIYLNKTCYNGLYRVNSQNEFNVPYGKYKNPEIYNKINIFYASKLLQDVKIKCQDYKHIEKYVKKGDFIYLDPCYDPLKKTSFVNYIPKGFCEIDRIELFNFMQVVQNKGVKIVLSNNDLPHIKNLYSNFKITKIPAIRSISSDPNKRGEIIELAISN